MAGNFRCLTCTGGRGSGGRLQKQRLLRLVLVAFVTLTTGADTKGLPAAAAAAAASPYVSAAASAAAAAVFAAAAASGGGARNAIVEATVAAAHAAGNTMQAVDQQAALQAAAAASSMSSMSGVLTDMLAQSQASKDFNWLKNTQMLLELLEEKRSGQYSSPPPPLSHMESRLQQMIDSLRRDTHNLLGKIKQQDPAIMPGARGVGTPQLGNFGADKVPSIHYYSSGAHPPAPPMAQIVQAACTCDMATYIALASVGGFVLGLMGAAACFTLKPSRLELSKKRPQ